ncbi:MAG TPA: NAD(P)H-hydrate dehydratase [Gemmatimonadetes bacterium]|nr:NAD(P)H-hydrate dehydratase [Gemmatimonadota bacterium]
MSTTPLRPYGAQRVWAPTATEAAAFDRAVIEHQGVPQAALMECAGRSAAEILVRLFPHGEVVALIGAGNNGGDGLVMLRTLKAWGRPVRAVLVADRDSENFLRGWQIRLEKDDGLGSGEGDLDAVLRGASVLVDAILGTGIRGAPRERQARAIRAINKSDRPVVALDTPSGVCGDTGRVAGEAVDAEVTVAFGWPKLGTLLQPGRSRVGRLIAVEIGFPPVPDSGFGAAVATPAWAAETRPRRQPDAHKNSVGTLLLVAGRPGMAGAAVMAARAALRSGVGLLRVVSSSENRSIIQGSVPEAIFVSAEDIEAVREAAAASQALAVGPGLGTEAEAAELLRRVLQLSGGLPTVLDADALNLASSGDGPGVAEWAAERPTLVTPHLGEMKRLTGLDGEVIQQDRLGAARDLASRTGAAVLLKGLPSIVMLPDGTCLVDSMGSSDLAVGGMGDVLTGVSGALLAQGLSPAESGALGLYTTGRAASRAALGPSLTPSDVIEQLPTVWSEEGPGESDLDHPFVIFDQDPAR